MSREYIWLKWRTLKEVASDDPRVLAALRKYHADTVMMGAATQEDTPAQKEALCEMIDVIAENGGAIINAWTMQPMTAEQAKKYVKEST
ncbi:MAG: hypothetical protein J0H40_19340 [Rhizobiales bacterium]|nr:hypothetical protein [Hyphomicrobiales bacterium]